jgi:hypothetical protein
LVLVSESLRVKAGREKKFAGSFTAYFAKKWFGIDFPKSAVFAVIVIICLFSLGSLLYKQLL